MSYSIKYGDLYLYDPRYEEYYLTDVELDSEENSCGYLDFSIYPTHPLYNILKMYDYKRPIEVYENDTFLFGGFAYEINETFQRERQVKCKGELEYLNDSVVRPFATYTRGFGDIAPATYFDIFNWLIDVHNSQASLERQFKVGINQGDIFDSIYYPPEDISFDNYPTVMDVISELLIGSDGVGGYLKVRHENGIKYIDWLYEHSNPNTQILEFGTNLTDYSKTEKTDDMVSFVLPTGARLRDTHYAYADGYYVKTESVPHSDESYYTRSNEYLEIPGTAITGEEFANQSNTTYKYYEKSYNSSSGAETYTATSDSYPRSTKTYYINYAGRYKYTEVNITSFASGTTYYKYNPDNDEGDTYLTISNLSDIATLSEYAKVRHVRGSTGLSQYILKTITEYETIPYRKQGDMIYSPEAVGKIGVRIAHVSNTNITTIEDLARAGIIYLENNTVPQYTFELKAIDLHLINPDIKPISPGEFIRVRSKPHNLDDFFVCRSITLDLNDPSQSTYILGLNYDTLTSDQANRLSVLENITNKQIDATTKLTEAEKRRSNSDIRNLSSISQDQDAAITSLFEMIIGS